MYKSSADLTLTGDLADDGAVTPRSGHHHKGGGAHGHGGGHGGGGGNHQGAGGAGQQQQEEPRKDEPYVDPQDTAGRGKELLGITGGIIFAFTLNGIELEGVTRRVDKTKHMELSLALMLICTVMYIFSAAAGRYVRGEQPAKKVPERMFMLLAVTTFSSTFCSVYCLKYVLMMRTPAPRDWSYFSYFCCLLATTNSLLVSHPHFSPLCWYCFSLHSLAPGT